MLIQYIPNLLSVGRMAAACLLLIDHPPLFAACYLFCGLSDVLDGFLARKYRVQSALGAKLDSLGDFVFWMIVLALLYTRTQVFTVWVAAAMALVAGIRLWSLVLTKLKFRQWGMLHTTGNKIAGSALFFLCFAAFYCDTLPWPVGGAGFALALLASVEELFILCRSTHYEPNPQGFFKTAR